MVKEAAAVLVVVLSLATACTPSAPTPPLTPEPTATTLNINLGGEPSTLDPSLAADRVSREVIDNLFLGLTGIQHDTGEVIPQLATDWEVSEDGLVWTFHLRENVYWVHYDPQTGVAEKKRRVTAHDVEYAVRRTIDPATGSAWAWLDYVIKNAEAVNTSAQSFAVGVGVKALDDYNVQFTLEQAAGYFPSIAGLIINYPLPKEAIQEFEDRWTEPGNLWSCGPYLLDTWRRRNRIVLVKNPHYYDAANLAIDTVTLAMVSDGSVSLNMYDNGDLDSTPLPLVEPLEELQHVRKDPQLSAELHWEPALMTACIYFNVSKPPMDDRLVRKALAAAIDKDKLLSEIMRTEHIPAKTFAPAGVFGSPADDPSFMGIPFDPQQARAWLADAGYRDGQGFPEVVALGIADERGQLAWEFIQQQWKDHLGIEVEAVTQEWEAYLQAVSVDPPHLFGHAWGALYRDENHFMLDACHPTMGGINLGWNPEDPAAVRFVQATEAAAAESDPQKRKALYFQAEKLLCVDAAVILPLWHGRLPYLTKPYVDRTHNPLGRGFARWRVEAH